MIDLVLMIGNLDLWIDIASIGYNSIEIGVEFLCWHGRYRPLDLDIDPSKILSRASPSPTRLLSTWSIWQHRYPPPDVDIDLFCVEMLCFLSARFLCLDVLDVEVFTRFRPLQKTSSSFSALLNSSIFILFSAKSHGNSCKPIYLTFKHKLHYSHVFPLMCMQKTTK